MSKSSTTTVRAKFRVISVSDAGHGDGSRQVTMEAVTSGSTENESFFKHTPSGHLNLGVMNEEAGKVFEFGKEYYLDFTPA